MPVSAGCLQGWLVLAEMGTVMTWPVSAELSGSF
jgi:hypothetical protein